jgi:hypothetical protein
MEIVILSATLIGSFGMALVLQRAALKMLLRVLEHGTR